jgi:hypothetical protein
MIYLCFHPSIHTYTVFMSQLLSKRVQWTWENKTLRVADFIFCGSVTSRRSTGSFGSSIFNLVKIFHAIFHNSWINIYSNNLCGLLTSTPPTIIIIFCLLIIMILPVYGHISPWSDYAFSMINSHMRNISLSDCAIFCQFHGVYQCMSARKMQQLLLLMVINAITCKIFFQNVSMCALLLSKV